MGSSLAVIDETANLTGRNWERKICRRMVENGRFEQPPFLPEFAIATLVVESRQFWHNPAHGME